jgi:trimeric autotransporter adhesin
MPSGGTGGGNPANQNPDTGFDSTVLGDITAGNFNAAFQAAIGTPETIGGMTQETDLLNPELLAQSGVTWNATNEDNYYKALAAYSGKLDVNSVNTDAETYSPAVASDTAEGHYDYLGGSFGTTAADLAKAESENTGAAPNPFATDFTPTVKDNSGGIVNSLGATVAVVAPIAIEAAAAYAGGLGAGALAGAAGAGTIGTAVAAGAGSGAIGAAASDTISGTPLTLGSVGKGAALGAVAGGITGGLQATGAQDAINSELGSTLGNVVTKAGASELTSLVGSTLTSPTGKSATTTSSLETSGSNVPAGQYEASNSGESSTGSKGLSPGVAPLAAAGVGAVAASAAPMSTTGGDPSLSVGDTPDSTAPASSGSSFLGDVGTGLTSALGGGSLGNVIGGALPYAAVAGIGMAQASAGEAQDAKYSQQQQALAQPALSESNTLLNKYNSNSLNTTDQNVVNTETKQGNQIIQSATGLSQIAQTAFAEYNSGKLNAADQTTLNQTVAAQKQQVAQQLASAGITDSTILAAQYQQIDNNAIVTKQNMLNNYFNTGSTAYNQWLTATTEGQQTIQDAQKFASSSLQTELANSMSEANIGMGEMNTAIQTQMTTDANYAAQVSTLLGTLATAYAKQVAGSKAGSTGSTGANAGNQVGQALGGQGVGTTATQQITQGTTGNTGGVSDESASLASSNASLGADVSYENSGAALGDPFNSGDILSGIDNPGYEDLGLDAGTASDLGSDLGDVLGDIP